MDRTTSEESWLHQKDPGLTLTPWLLRVCVKTVVKLCAKYVLALNLLSITDQQSGNCLGGCGWATCFLSAGQSKCEAAGCKLGRLHCCCRVAATATSRSRLCWLRNNNYFPFASLRGNNALFLRRWLSAATQLFPDKLVHFQGKYPNFTKFVLCMVLWIEPPVLLQ